jgi:hypothetical protein
MIFKKFKLSKIFVCALLIVVMINLYFNDPNAPESLYPGSLIKSLTGFYCPGCGVTRAIYQLLHGNLKSALALNPLLVIFLPYFIYLFIAAYLLEQKRLNDQNILYLIIIFLVYGVMRNLPFYPFYLLAPG